MITKICILLLVVFALPNSNQIPKANLMHKVGKYKFFEKKN